MRFILISLLVLIIPFAGSNGQKYEPVTVKAGMKVSDCFPFNERYRYAEFTNGHIQMKSGVYADTRLNLDFLSNDILYIKGKDTLTVANKKDIRFISIALDTFCFDKGAYLELLTNGKIRVGLKQYIKLRETLKQDSYGSSSSGSAINSYGSLPSQGSFYKLTANTDMVFQRTLEYYLSNNSGEFVPFIKKYVLELFPEHEQEIKAYLKANKISFDKKDDLLKLAGYLRSL